jgi:hypothetical protein
MKYSIEIINYKGVDYDNRHGGPFDRGSADSYYGRIRTPHFYIGATDTSQKVLIDDMTEDEIESYHAGYDYNEDQAHYKKW